MFKAKYKELLDRGDLGQIKNREIYFREMFDTGEWSGLRKAINELTAGLDEYEGEIRVHRVLERFIKRFEKMEKEYESHPAHKEPFSRETGIPRDDP